MQNVNEIARLRVDAYKDREALIIALVNSGYWVRVQEIKPNLYTSEYWVVVETYEVNGG